MTRPSLAEPRPSTSSNRSRQADFEAALLNPAQTKYISSSPIIDEGESTSPSQDVDAPDPIGKRSFDEDYEQTIRTPVKNVRSPSVIPPTPSTAGTYARSRTSTSTSNDSGGGRRASRIKPLQAIDMHQEMIQEDAAIARKKPSIFRSPGTASSPDLATLVRLAKEARAKNTPPKNQTGMRSSSSKMDTRSRAVSQASATASEWEGHSNNGDVRSIGSGMSSGDRMTSISESARTRSNDESRKSVRNKAKGMLGKMFGSASKDHSTSAPSRIPSNSRPPVPPIPQSYAIQMEQRKRSQGSTNADVFGAVQSTDGRSAESRAIDGTGEKGTDKPLPTITSANGSPAKLDPEESLANTRSPTATQRRSMHTRQAANDLFDKDEEGPPQTTPQKALASFSEDVNGMFSGIGETHLANELGLPPDSLRIKARPSVGRSAVTEGSRHFPSLSHRLPEDRSVPVPSRTTSLPGKPSAIGSSSLGPISLSRTPSSPNLAPRPLSVASRSSSTSSAHRKKRTDHTDFGPSDGANEDTLKGRTRETSGATITGPSHTAASVRLVASPRPPSAHSVRTPGEGENEWLTSPTSVTQTEDTLERIVTPGSNEDDDEKGRRLACEFLEDDYRNVSYDRVAMFLGGPRNVNQVALRYYMQYFDMQNQNLVDSFRDLCKKLHLKAESQEIDRIIGAFSSRYFECNPTTVFGTAGVVHTVTGAMLMLNTDLHIADLSKHMSRNDFVRNAMRAVQESMPTDGVSTPDLAKDDSGSGTGATGSTVSAASSVRDRRPRDALTAPRSASAPVTGPPYGVINGKKGESSSSVGSFSYNKAWEQEAESALRDIYTNVRTDKILLPIGGTSGSSTHTWKRQSVMSMSALSDRSRTMRSPPGSRVNALKRGSVVGSQSLLSQPTLMSDGRLSPTPSYATSIDETIANAFAPSFGFASNLTHAVIKEHDDETRSTTSALSVDTQDDMDDDELALLGPPWAKEGILSRKLYYESDGKRARKSDWKQVFVVVQKGEISMFTFGAGAKGASMGGSMGGGNWTTNANTVGSASLMHSKSVALPKPGYNASRPYCFSLTLPTGEVSIYQAGTEDLVTEWVQTCNYWAARTSRQPLQGGVSNMEYGWSRVADTTADEEDRASVRSGKSSLSKFKGTYGRKGVAADKIHINDWRPPPPATMASPLDEENQLEALTAYVNNLKDELEQHKAVEQPMSNLYTPGSKNLNKARENYKAKLQYTHTEIYKYETYLEALRAAVALRVEKQGEKKLERSLKRSMGSLHVLDDGEHEEEAEGRATPTPAR